MNITKEKIISFLMSMAETFVQALVLYVVVSLFIIPVKVDGLSMYPTLNHNNYLVTIRSNFVHGYERGDIVVFNSNLGKVLVKRVIGLPGETIEISEGTIYINGTGLEEDYLNNKTIETMEVTLKDNEYFLMGDNRQNSSDSRNPFVGPVKENEIMGRVVFKIAPMPSIIEKEDY